MANTQQSDFNATNLKYYGLSGLSITDWGTIVTNAIGISQGTVRYKIMPMQAFSSLQPPMWSSHPLAPYMLLTKRVASFREGFCFVDCSYEGLSTGYTPVPVYELAISCGEEPIETNPNFINFAGTPSAPLNGAIFTSIKANPSPPATMQQPGTDGDQWYVFSKFIPVLDDGTRNPYVGILKWLSPDQITWRRISAAISGSNSLFATIGEVSFPPGPVPNFSPRNWLYMGASQTQRGNCFEMADEWKLSGINGWMTGFEGIYPPYG